MVDWFFLRKFIGPQNTQRIILLDHISHKPCRQLFFRTWNQAERKLCPHLLIPRTKTSDWKGYPEKNALVFSFVTHKLFVNVTMCLIYSELRATTTGLWSIII